MSQAPPQPTTQSAPTNTLLWASLLIAGGIVTIADRVGILPTLNHSTIWNWLMLCSGSVLLINAIFHTISKGIKGSGFGLWISGSILLVLSINVIFGPETLSQLGPMVFVLFGVASLIRALQ